MFFGRIHRLRLVALALPVCMLWVFLVCSFECAGAVRCGDGTDSACCRSMEDAACGTMTGEDAEPSACLLVPDDPAVLAAGTSRPEAAPDSVPPSIKSIARKSFLAMGKYTPFPSYPPVAHFKTTSPSNAVYAFSKKLSFVSFLSLTKNGEVGI